MPKPRLLLLTEHYPFGVTESFLESEVPYLAEHFDVEVLPTAVQPYEWSQKRAIPAGVSISDALARQIAYSPGKWLRELASRPGRLYQAFRLIASELSDLPRQTWALRRLVRFTIQAVLTADLVMKLTPEAAIYYSYWLTSGALALALSKSAGNQGVFLSRAHGGDLYRHPEWRRYQPFQRLIVRELDHVVTISQHGGNYLRNLHPNHEKKIRVCRLGVMPAKKRARPAVDGKLHLVSCAHLQPVKRIGLLIQALSLCTIPICWTHLGGGSMQVALIEQARMLPANVQWHFRGPLPNEQVLEFYAKEPVDLFINLSATEGLPVSIMEAMSFGLPIIATDVGGTSEIVDDENGFLLSVDVGPEQVADLIAGFHFLPEETKASLRDASWMKWREGLDEERQYPEFADWMHGLVR